MNWYKKSQNDKPAPINITSYRDTYEELGISFNGSKTYHYPHVNKHIYREIAFLLSKKNYRAVEKKLKDILQKNKDKDAELKVRYPRKSQNPAPEPQKQPQQNQFPFME